MAKNKKKKAQMFRDFLAFKAGQGNQPGSNQPSSFQTPHSDQEKLTELLDDDVGGGTSQANKQSISEINLPTQQISKWTALKPVEDSGNIQVHMRQANNDNKRPNLNIVEGSASKIQLIIDNKSKKVTAQPTNIPRPVEETKPSTPIQTPSTQEQTQTSPAQISQPQISLAKISQAQISQPQISLANISQANISQPQISQTSQAKISHSQTTTGYILKSAYSSLTNMAEIYEIRHKRNTHSQPEIIPPHWPIYNHPAGWPNPPIPNQPKTGSGWPKSMAPSTITVLTCDTSSPQGNDLNDQADSSTTPRAYSPSDVYSDGVNNDEMHARTSTRKTSIGVADDELESPEIIASGSKRLSAFQRLGPLAEQPKKKKLTINLLCQKDVRNVVDETDDIATHLKDYITKSTDDIVVKYLDAWPFKKNIVPVRTATARQSKSVMILETEYMEEAYTRDSRFVLVMVTGYPPHWKKEDVLDAVLKSVKEKTFIPCFVEFSKVQCRFLVIRCRVALLAIHKYGFIIRQNDVELIISLSNIHLNLNQLDFVPRLILRKIMSTRLDAASLDLSHFTTKNDISHFIYFPLYRAKNQAELLELQSTVPWECLTTLNLSHNKIVTLDGIDFLSSTPKLQNLDLSHNCIEKAKILLSSRNLPLKTIRLEGNPLCLDYIEQEHYIKVLTMIFTGLVEIDGVKIKQLNPLPDSQRNYSPTDSIDVAEKTLEVFFPLLDAPLDQRLLIQDLYEENAVLTITFMYKLRYDNVYKEHRNLFKRARVLDEGDMEAIVGASAITKIINRWPALVHDPTTFTVDVIYHNISTTIIRVGGIVKIATESLADEEHLLSFTRTLVLHTKDGTEYKITNELLYWDSPLKEYAETAFQITRVKPKNLRLRLDAPPDDDLKERLLNVFMEITELEKSPSERCLEEKNWNFKNALDYFTKLLKLGNLDPIILPNNA